MDWLESPGKPVETRILLTAGGTGAGFERRVTIGTLALGFCSAAAWTSGGFINGDLACEAPEHPLPRREMCEADGDFTWTNGL